jgi:pyridoxal phosphate enzyme (YggS family)
MTASAGVASIAAAVARVRERVAAACARAGRDPAGVTLIAASKTRTAEEIVEACAAGIEDFGENYVQEGAAKFRRVAELAPGITVRRHLIGHLQRNKVNAALEAFDVLHGVDSERLLLALSHRATRAVPVFIEVNLAGEPTKSGAAPGEVGPLVARAAELENVRLLGLMAIPPASPPAEARRWFGQLRELAHAHGLRHLSMGMTDDFEIAIEEGATHIRVGRAIFGERPA